MIISIANPISDSAFKNVEDEFFKTIENRDTAIMTRDKRIAEQNAQIAEKDTQLRSQTQALLKKGVDIEGIANIVGIPTEQVRQQLK